MSSDRLLYVLGGGLGLLMLVALLRPDQPSSLDIDFRLRANSGDAQHSSSSGSGSAEGLIADYNNGEGERRPRSGCFGADTIRGAKVLAFGAYEGGAAANVAFAGEGSRVGRVQLQANADGPPLLPVFSAYDPIVWDFAGVPAHRVKAVLIYGYAPQAVANLPDTIPVRFVSHADGITPCGRSRYAHKQTSELGALRTQVQQVLGVPIERFTGSYNPRSIQLDGGSFSPMVEAALKPSQLRTGAPIQLGGLLAGDKGLQQLVKKGDLRRATATDLARWTARAKKPNKLYLEETYVVLRQTTLPDGMEGLNARFFLIPRGVPLPHNGGVHNGFYHLENGSCSGFC